MKTARTKTSVHFQDYEFYTCAKTGHLMVSWDEQKNDFYVMDGGAKLYRAPCLRYTGFTTAAMEDHAALIFQENELYRG